VPSQNYIPIWIQEGLLLETRPDQMENFKNVDDRWVNVEWDMGRHYSVPWQWGSTGVLVDTSLYKGDINTSGIIFNPPDELKGKINVAPEMNDVMAAVIWYLGGQWCTSDKELLKKDINRILTLLIPFVPKAAVVLPFTLAAGNLLGGWVADKNKKDGVRLQLLLWVLPTVETRS